jgi:hypothetical protein
MTYLHLHVYPDMMNPTDRCSFPYLFKFMAAVAVAVLAHVYPDMMNPDRPLFLSILSQIYGRGCCVGAYELKFSSFHLCS